MLLFKNSALSKRSRLVNFCFPKLFRLCRRSDFQRMASFEFRYSGRCILMELRPNKLGHSRLGITVTRRHGKAVVRNYFKRIVREAYRLNRHQLIDGYDIHIKPRHGALGAKRKDIEEDLKRFLGKGLRQG